MTTFAWFTFSKILNSGMLIHIDSWNLDFYIDEDGDGELELEEKKENPINIDVSNLYPGMPEQVTEVVIKNTGETDSLMDYILDKVYVLGQEYNIVIIPPDEGDNYILKSYPEQLNPDADESEQKIYGVNFIDEPERFPFKIVIEYTDEVKQGEQGFLKIRVNWPGYATYEDGDDEETKAEKDKAKDAMDSKWGYLAGKFESENTNEELSGAIRLQLKINAVGQQRQAEGNVVATP